MAYNKTGLYIGGAAAFAFVIATVGGAFDSASPAAIAAVKADPFLGRATYDNLCAIEGGSSMTVTTVNDKSEDNIVSAAIPTQDITFVDKLDAAETKSIPVLMPEVKIATGTFDAPDCNENRGRIHYRFMWDGKPQAVVITVPKKMPERGHASLTRVGSYVKIPFIG